MVLDPRVYKKTYKEIQHHTVDKPALKTYQIGMHYAVQEIFE